MGLNPAWQLFAGRVAMHETDIRFAFVLSLCPSLCCLALCMRANTTMKGVPWGGGWRAGHRQPHVFQRCKQAREEKGQQHVDRENI